MHPPTLPRSAALEAVTTACAVSLMVAESELENNVKGFL